MTNNPIQHTSNARAFFHDIVNQEDPFAFLSDIPFPLRAEPFFEEEWIDFKGEPQDDSDAKKIWSKALSGYANITDGLVIWGIDARPMPPRDIDAACGLRLISDPHAFESKLRDWIRDSTNPPVMGVEYKSFPGPSNEGFVVCLVPESSHKPHRAEFANRYYYYRAGDDFLPAEPGLLRTLFYPQLHPYIWVEVTLHYELIPEDLGVAHRKNPSVESYNKLLNSTSSMGYDVKLHNNGPATAKDVYVVVQTNDEIFIQGSNHDWQTSNNPQGQAAFYAQRPLHPGEITQLFSASIPGTFYNRSVGPSNEYRITPYFEKKYLQFLIYAENSERQELIVEFEPEDLDFNSASAMKEGLPTDP